jgi:hypothetical protein
MTCLQMNRALSIVRDTPCALLHFLRLLNSQHSICLGFTFIMPRFLVKLSDTMVTVVVAMSSTHLALLHFVAPLATIGSLLFHVEESKQFHLGGIANRVTGVLVQLFPDGWHAIKESLV